MAKTSYCATCDRPGQGRPSPEAMMHFPPCFRFPSVSELFFDSVENFPNFENPKTFFDFQPPKFLMTFFIVINHKFRIPPIFAMSIHFPPYFEKIILSPVFGKFTCFLHILCVFRFPPTLCITQCTYWMPLGQASLLQKMF